MRSYIKRHKQSSASWDIPTLCAAYNWPTGLPGGGVVAIVELGGGWNSSDVAAAFASMSQPTPVIRDISVDGTVNAPGGDADGEVALDIQVAAASYFMATGSPATIYIYWAKDIATAVRAATADGCDVCSISWGADEAVWGVAAAVDMEAAAKAAANAGMVVLAASGDNDSSDGGPNPANVDVPASCPHIIGCGGTSKPHDGVETVWNNNPGQSTGEGTGGGYSTIFPTQAWQGLDPAGPSGRMVPDVSANADPMVGYEIVLNGQIEIVGGTSAVAPLYAGLFAALGKKLGFITPDLFLNPIGFNDITVGDNGAYTARPGPDPCTGLGSPVGTVIESIIAAKNKTS